MAADLADTLHRGDLRDAYLRQAADVRDAINATLWDATAGAYVDGDLRDHHPLDGNALAVLFGIAEGERATQALSFVHDRLWTPLGTLAADRAYGAWAQDSAIWPAYVYPDVEARFSVNDDVNALDLVRRTWGGMLALGPSSTFWEFATQDGGIHDGSTSLAHGWSSGALPALSRGVLGVRAVRPGYSEYVIAPHPADLEWACGVVPTPAGAIRSAWRQDGGNFTLWLDAPMGTSSRFVVPGEPTGQVLLDVESVPVSSTASTGLGQIDLPPGTHVVEVAREVQTLPD